MQSSAKFARKARAEGEGSRRVRHRTLGTEFERFAKKSYINHTVATLLDKLRVEFTKSRPRNSNDNALAETKNAAIVRKHMG